MYRSSMFIAALALAAPFMTLAAETVGSWPGWISPVESVAEAVLESGLPEVSTDDAECP